MTFDAVLLTGGRARRLGGADKAALVVGDRTLSQRVAGAVAGAARLIVVGPCPSGLDREAVVTREDPAHTGPVAAIAAGMRHVRAPQVVVLAVDQPFVTARAVDALLSALGGVRGPNAEHGADLALPVDGTGRDQPLCVAWRSDALRAALDRLGDPAGAPVRRLVEAAGTVARLTGLAADGAEPPPWFDCDTPDDLAQAEGWA